MSEKTKQNLRILKESGLHLYASNFDLGVFEHLTNIESIKEKDHTINYGVHIPYHTLFVVAEKKQCPFDDVIEDIFLNCFLKIKDSRNKRTIYLFKKSDFLLYKKIHAEIKDLNLSICEEKFYIFEKEDMEELELSFNYPQNTEPFTLKDYKTLFIFSSSDDIVIDFNLNKQGVDYVG